MPPPPASVASRLRDAGIEAVTAEDLSDLANEFFKTESVAVTVLGNLPGLKITRDQLAC